MTTATPRAAPLPKDYPADLRRGIESDTGLRYHLRPIRPDDAPGLVAFHSRLSPHSCYLRFFSFHPTLSPQEVTRFTCVDYENRLALVAEVGDQLIAVGRFDRITATTEAEVAFVVADSYQHHGIGSLLLDELMRAARQRGIDTFVADTLWENRTMLEVFRHTGLATSTTLDCGTVTLRFPLEPTAPYGAALAIREQSRHALPEGRVDEGVERSVPLPSGVQIAQDGQHAPVV
jgi:GNAT superfamily N-acetyltransferase